VAGDRPLFLGPKILVLPCDSEACINSKDSIRQIADRPGQSAGSAVRRVDRPGTPLRPAGRSSGEPSRKNRSVVWLPIGSRATAKIIHRGRNVTDAAFLVDSLIKAVGCLKKEPQAVYAPGALLRSLPQLRLLAGRQGCRGTGLAARSAYCVSSRTVSAWAQVTPQ
jgi:hypothetical protein